MSATIIAIAVGAIVFMTCILVIGIGIVLVMDDKLKKEKPKRNLAGGPEDEPRVKNKFTKTVSCHPPAYAHRVSIAEVKKRVRVTKRSNKN